MWTPRWWNLIPRGHSRVSRGAGSFAPIRVCGHAGICHAFNLQSTLFMNTFWRCLVVECSIALPLWSLTKNAAQDPFHFHSGSQVVAVVDVIAGIAGTVRSSTDTACANPQLFPFLLRHNQGRRMLIRLRQSAQGWSPLALVHQECPQSSAVPQLPLCPSPQHLPWHSPCHCQSSDRSAGFHLGP